MRTAKRNISLGRDQRGLVSFLVVIVIMAILTLIVVAYAQITRREQRQALDRQLNSQAFYAAESGVNDVMRSLRANSTLIGDNYTDCEGDNSFIKAAGLAAEANISDEDSVSYSCLLVNTSPSQLTYDNITTGGSQVIPIRSKTGNITRLSFSWKNRNEDNHSIKTGCPAQTDVEDGKFNFKPTPEDCQHPVLRIEIVPFSSGMTPDELIAQRAVFFVQPVVTDATPRETSELSYGFSTGAGLAGLNSQGRVVPAWCTRQERQGFLSRCGVGISFPSSGFEGYVRVTSLYHPSQLWLTGQDTSGGSAGFVGAQVEIDATGRASDVVKRIRVYRSLGQGTNTPIPGYALQSTKTQCKLFSISGASITIGGAATGELRDLCDPTK